MEHTGLSPAARRQITWVVLLGAFVTSMATTVTSNMLPTIMRDLQVPAGTAQWLTSGATLTSGVMIPVTAFLLKRFPNRRYFLAALLCYCLGSLAALAAPAFPVLLAGRLVQAVGCGMLLPFSQVMLMSIHPRERHGAVMGGFSFAALVAPIVAPTLAGFLIDLTGGWRPVFAVLLGLGVLILVLGLLFVRNVTPAAPQRFHGVSILLSSVGFCGVLIGVSNLSRGPLLRLQSGGAILIGLAALAAFSVRQLRSDEPVLELRVFRRPQFRLAVFVSVLQYILCMGTGMLMPVFSQTACGYTPMQYALATLAGSILMAAMTFLSGRVFDRIGSRALMLCGGVLMLVSSVLGLRLRLDSTLAYIGVVTALNSLGMSCINTPITTLALSGLEGRLRMDGSAIFNTLRQVSSSFAATLAVLVYSRVGDAAGPTAGVRAVNGYFVAASLAVLALTLVFHARYGTMRRRPAGDARR